MSHRLSCLSTDFGLHLIRTIASFISSMFVCRLNENYKDSSSSRSSSSRSSFSSSSQSSPVLFSFSSPPKSFILQSLSPYGERRKHRQKRSQLKPFKSTDNEDEYCNDFQTSEEYGTENMAEPNSASRTADQQQQQLQNPPRQMEKKLKVTEKELSYLNHKIEKLLVKLEEEYEIEMAASPDEECVICISAKATMQTFPCAHRVVCRKCFVKTIQMVVSQRMLPLRCVICRAKVLRLKQTTTGGLSTGYVRSNSKLCQSAHLPCQFEQNSQQPLQPPLPQHSSDPLVRPVSLANSAGCPNLYRSIAMMHYLPAMATSSISSSCSTPPSPLTEVFQAQKALYELQANFNCSDSALRSSCPGDNCNIRNIGYDDDAGNTGDVRETLTETVGQCRNGQHQHIIGHSRSGANQLVPIQRSAPLQSTLAWPHTASANRIGHQQLIDCSDFLHNDCDCGEQATLSQSSTDRPSVRHCPCLCSRMSAATSVAKDGQWLDSPTVTQPPSCFESHFELTSKLPATATTFPCSANTDSQHSADQQQNPTSPSGSSVFNYLPQWCFVVHRKRKHARHLQHRRWPSIKSTPPPQPLPPQPSSNFQQQQQLFLPDNANFQTPVQTEQLEDLGFRQGTSSFLVPIKEEDEDLASLEPEISEHRQSNRPDKLLPNCNLINSISNIEQESNSPTTSNTPNAPSSPNTHTSNHRKLSASSSHLTGAALSNSYQSQSQLCSSTSASLQSINAYSANLGNSNIHHSRLSLKQHAKANNNKIRKSRSESFLQTISKQYRRLDDDKNSDANYIELYQTEEGKEEKMSNQSISDQLTTAATNNKSRNSSERFRSEFRASSLTSLLSSTIQELKHFGSRISLAAKRPISIKSKYGSTVQYSNVSLSGDHLTH